MGCASSHEPIATAALAQSRAIEKMLEKERLNERRTTKILLLGTGESGKSTVLKQMVIIHQKGGFSDEERMAYREVIYSNTHQSLRTVLESLPLLRLSLDPSNRKAATTVMEMDAAEDPHLLLMIRPEIILLVQDPAVREALEHTAKFQLNNSAGYFFDNVGRTITGGYVPSDDDIVRARVRTTGINEYTFSISKQTWKIFDVGGQRSERRKWIACFENVNVLIFLVALNEYDEQLFEDETVSRMQEALVLFQSIINSQWFIKTTKVLFLNKTDLFTQKIGRIPLGNFFPEYTGGNFFEPAATFLRDKFLSLYTQEAQLYTHYTSAVDTSSTTLVMRAIEDTITREMVAQVL